MSMTHRGEGKWLSVVMPVFNGGDFLSAALDSLTRQESRSFEVVVIDDGSTDDSLEIIRRYSGSLDLHIFAEPRRGSWVRGLNLGIERARGEYVTVLCQDDTWLDGRMAALEALRSARPDLSVIIHPSEFIDARGRRVGTWSCPFSGNAPREISSEEMLRSLIIQNFVSLPGVMFRRRLARQVGSLDTELWYTADWQLWLELALRVPWYYIPKPLTCFRLHGRSQTSLGAKSAAALRDQYRRVQKAFLSRLPFEAHELERLGAVGSVCTDLNYSLAMAAAGSWRPLMGALGRIRRLPFADRRSLVRDSRLIPRVVSRVRAGLF